METRKRRRDTIADVKKSFQEEESKETKRKGKRERKSKAKLVPEPESDPEPEQIVSQEDGNGNVRVFYGYSDEMAYLNQLVRILFRQNKANSVIVCGETGIGKNYLVDACLAQYPTIKGEDDPEYGHLNVVLFKFDGNLHGKNDLATLRIIGRRLNLLLEKARQVTVEEEGEEEELDESEMSSKVANSIPKIIAQFRFLIEHSANFRCVIILDNFEVFSYRQQYLLYNLFDLIQQGQSVLIIGLTRRLDCIQLMTSRVQSRLNRRMIHLTAPFKTQRAYSAFCHDYAKKLGFEGTLPKSAVERAFSSNRSFSALKRFVQEYTFVPPQTENIDPKLKSSSTLLLHGDPMMVQLFNLNRNELFLLIIASKQLRNLEEETFTCRHLYDWSSRITQLKSLTFEHMIKCIYKLIEFDLLIVAKETRSQTNKSGAQLWISPYTSLMLNISDFQLKETMERISGNLPEYMKQMLR